MNKFALFTFIALLGTGLSGCTEPEPESAAQNVDECVIERPGDFEACEQSYAPADPLTSEHLHDYWGGADRLTIMDDEFESLSINGGGSLWFRYDPKPDHVVPQGTASVEFTIAWEEAATNVFADVELWLKTAADDDSKFVAAIENGETVTFESTNAQNDLPHQQLSGWQIWLRMNSVAPPAGGAFQGTVHVQMEAVRGLEIPLYPGHPDQWNGSTDITLLDDNRLLIGYHYSNQLGGNVCVQCPAFHDVDDGIIVPYDAREVQVTLEFSAANAGDLDLAYHGADRRDFVRLEPDQFDGVQKTYVIPVDGNGDGPYAKQSLWEFRVYPGGQVDDAFTPVGSYNLLAVAYA